MKYDVIIVGAGPGGLFTAYKLAGKLKVAIFELGRDIDKRKCPSDLAESFCTKCKPCNITFGVGGAGGLSGGKLNYAIPEYPSSYTVGGDLIDLIDAEYLLKKWRK